MDYDRLVYELRIQVVLAHQHINPTQLTSAQCSCGWVAGPFDNHSEHLARKVADWFMQELNT